MFACLLYDVHYADAVTSVRGLDGVCVITTLNDGVVVPLDCLIHVEDLCLRVFLERRYIYFYVDDTVALSVRVACGDGVAVNAIGLVDAVAVGLTADVLRSTATYIVVFSLDRSGINRQVETVDTIRTVDGGVSVFVLFGCSDGVLELVACMVLRTGGPEERQRCLTDCRVVLEQVGRINDKY